MTNELAIRILRGDVLGTNEQTHEAVFMAIRALKAEPVKHGRWIRKDSKRCYWYECSNCGYPPPLDRYKHEWFSEYCPNCGAKMDREKLSEIMGYLWAKSDNDALCAGYAEALGDMLAEDEKRGTKLEANNERID